MKSHKQNFKDSLKYRSYKFSLDVINLLSTFPNNQIFWIFKDQLLRSATSIGANIAEATGSSSKKEFARFFEISLRSSNEVKYWLCLLRDSNLVGINQEAINALLCEVVELSNMLGASLITIRGKR